MYDIPLLDSVQYFISYTIIPTDILHPSPAPHVKIFQVFLIHFPKSMGKKPENIGSSRDRRILFSPMDKKK